jgi:hypothetical protein
MNLPINYKEADWQQRKEARLQYGRLQKNLCWHCGCDLNGSARKDIEAKPINKKLFPASMFAYPVHLHHDHDTGLTIGAVHNICNAVLWQYHGK